MKLPVKLKNGAIFYVEAEGVEPDGVIDDPGLRPPGTPMGGPSPTERIEQSFDEALAVIEGIADEVNEKLVKSAKAMRPAEVALELQVGFDASGKVYLVAEAKAKASLKLTLKWKPKG